jgi:hypothetical protein
MEFNILIRIIFFMIEKEFQFLVVLKRKIEINKKRKI